MTRNPCMSRWRDVAGQGIVAGQVMTAHGNLGPGMARGVDWRSVWTGDPGG